MLQSLCEQTVKDFEVIIVEDGSIKPCKDVCNKYAGILSLHYYAKENSGPGQSRNYGAERANGEYVIILDSDVVLPKGYLQAIERSLSLPRSAEGRLLPAGRKKGHQLAAFGGPDAAHPDFTPVQKAISYSMTSFFTTGGIRGGKAKLDKFYPRSFNMGIRRDVYQQLGVWHKRRTDFRKFFRQVYNSGIARINLEKRHPGTMKLVHLLPTVFTVGVIALILISAVGRALMHYVDHDQFYWMCFAPWLPILLYSFLIFIDSSIKNKSLHVGLLSIPAAFIQLMGYGLGFIESWWKRCILKQDEFQAFDDGLRAGLHRVVVETMHPQTRRISSLRANIIQIK